MPPTLKPKFPNDRPKGDLLPKLPPKAPPKDVVDGTKANVPVVNNAEGPPVKTKRKWTRRSLLVVAIACLFLINGSSKSDNDSDSFDMRSNKLLGRQSLINFCEDHSADALELCSNCANRGFTLELKIDVDDSALRRDSRVLFTQSANFNLTFKTIPRLLVTFFVVTPKDTIAMTMQLKEVKHDKVQAMCSLTHFRRTEHLGTMIGFAPMALRREEIRTKFLKSPVISSVGAVVLTADGESNTTNVNLIMTTPDSTEMVFCDQARYDEAFIMKELRIHIFSAKGEEFEQPPTIKFITRCHVAEPV